MRVFFDHQTFSLQNFGGISRYYSELVSGINRTAANEAYLPLLFSNNIHLEETGRLVRNFLPNRKVYRKQQAIYHANRLYTVAQLKTKSFDVFHATYYDPYFIPYLKGHPFTITFLDMIHERFGSQYRELADGGLMTKRKQFLADRADRIIAISESTKRDIVEFLNVDPRKIDVVYLGNSLHPTSGTTTGAVTANPYLLFVGRREGYKNFDGLLQTIQPILKKYGLKLLCAGGDPFTADEKKRIHDAGADGLVEQRPINDQTLPLLYQRATAFIFPTFYEGFGIPVLEAFSCSCPCIVSNLSSLPEVAGDAALYIDPNTPDSIAAAVETLLSDAQLRQNLIAKGKTQLARFSWQHTVDKTLDLYKTLV